MSAFLDTNVLIRHLTGDPPAQARRARAFLAAADELLVPDLIVAEVVYVLESFYEVARERVAQLVRAVTDSRQLSSSTRPCFYARSRCTNSTESTSPTPTSSRARRRAESGRSRRSTAASTESRQFGDSSRRDRGARLAMSSVERASLPAGDYAVEAKTVIERKRVLDLMGLPVFSAQVA